MKKKRTGMRWALWLTLAGALVLLLQSRPQWVGDRFRPVPESPFETRECWFEVNPGDGVTCGFLVSRERPVTGEGLPILIPAAIFKTGAWFPEPDPVVVLGGGGPGNPVGLSRYSEDDFREAFGPLALEQGRDLIVIDPRGVGQARPNLECPEMLDFLELTLAWPSSDPRTLEAYLLALDQCRNRLKRESIDLAAYNTENSARDLHRLRQALNYDHWNLVGVSYGAELAFALLEQDGAAVRSLVLDSPSLPGTASADFQLANFHRALLKLWEACSQSAVCDERFPRLAERFRGLLQRLSAEPRILRLTHPQSLEPADVLLDDLVLIDLVFNALYDPEDIERVPLWLHAADQGAYDLVTEVARRQLAELYQPNSDALAHSVLCQEGLVLKTGFHLKPSLLREAPWLAPYGRVLDRFAREGCALWQVPEARPLHLPEGDPLPTLILSGDLDPVTPPEWGARIQRALPNSRWWLFAGLSHNLLSDSDCALEQAGQFIADPQAAPADPDCPDAGEPLEFVLHPD